jgi:uncharacterized protein YndB with AHSA1/START domain
MTGRVATAEAEIRAPRSKVWRALTDPDQIHVRFARRDRLEAGEPNNLEGSVRGPSPTEEAAEHSRANWERCSPR